jgi:hypothetical protein
MRRIGVSTFALAAGLLAANAAFAQQQSDTPVGVTSAVNPDARGVRPDGGQKVLMVGNDVIYKERIETGPSGQVQLLFNDQSAISVGPDAQLVIDQYVYNPANGTGQMAVTLARGTMRFVGGKISKQSEVAISTPSATIGIRGGVTMPSVADDGSTRVVHVFGTTTVRTADGQNATLTRPGFIAEVAAPRSVAVALPAPAAPQAQGAPPAAPPVPADGGIAVRRASEAEISLAKGQLEAGPTQQVARAQAPSAAPPVQQGSAPQQSGAQAPAQQASTPQGPASQPGPAPAGAAIEGALGGSGFTGRNSGVAPTQIATVGNIQPGFAAGPPPAQQAAQSAQAGGQIANTTGAAQTGAVSTIQQNLQGFSLGYTIFGRARYGNWIDAAGTNPARPNFDGTNGTRTLSATITDGRFNGTLANGETFTFGVPNDAAGRFFATGPGGTAAPPGTFQGSSFLSSDRRFFFGNYTISNGEKLAVFAGTPVSGAALRDNSSRVVREYTLRGDPLLGSNIPFVPPMEAGGSFANPWIGKFTTVTPAGGGTAGRGMQVSFAFDGSGSSQRNLLAVTTVNIFDDGSGKTLIAGGGRATYDLTGDVRPGRLGWSASSEVDGAGQGFFGSLTADGAPTNFVLGQNSFNTSNTRVTDDAYRGLVTASGFPNNTADQYYRTSTVASYDRVVTGSTAASASFFNGYVSGLAERGDVFGIKQLNNDPTQTVLRFNPSTNTVTALLAFERLGAAESFKLALGARPTTIAGATADFSAALGDITNSGFTTFDAGGARSALIDEKTWAAREMVNPGTPNDGNGNSTFASALVTSNQTNSPASVTNEPLTARLDMVPWTAISSTALQSAFPNATFNNFESLQWGFWAGSVNFPDPLVTGGRSDRYNLATWVAGVLPAFIDIPASGTATYNGHAIGTVYNNGARYSAAGNYQQTWNFGTDSGNVSISNFDGLATITGSVTAGNRREFVGTLSNGAGVTGNINGSFFRGTSDPVKNVGGNFSLTGTNYQAGGIVVGQR